MHIERRRPGVTMRLLHEKHLAAHADAYGYTQFISGAPSSAAPRRVRVASDWGFSIPC